MGNLMTYDIFCTLRDQRRTGQEAPQFTEKQAFEIAMNFYLNCKTIDLDLPQLQGKK